MNINENTVLPGFIAWLICSCNLGLIFIMATGSIIMLKQLATAAENREQYILLTKLGVSLRRFGAQFMFKQG
jgi:putative ABC transport system permease protein